MHLDNYQGSCRPTQFWVVSQRRNSVRGFSLRDWLQLTQYLFGIIIREDKNVCLSQENFDIKKMQVLKGKKNKGMSVLDYKSKGGRKHKNAMEAL